MSTQLPAQTSTPLPTSTPEPPHITTPLGPFVVTKVETKDRIPLYAAAPGYQILLVTLEPMGAVSSSESSDDRLLEYTSSVVSSDGAIWESIGTTVTREGDRLDPTTLDNLSWDFAFAVPADAVGFTLWVPGSDPIVLPTPSP
jgi:hypothetical protein